MPNTTERTMEANHRTFLRLVAAAQSCSRAERKAQHCAHAALFAVNNPCGVFYSHALETMLQALALTIPAAPVRTPSENRFLHVVTRCYASGGHTRVLERWISASPATQRHDVVLISQGRRPVPPYLEEVVQQKSGGILHLAPRLPLEKAAELRALAGDYSAIILHVHPYDIVPMLALSHTKFARPIVLFNHADHLFWLGTSLADLVVNFRSSTLEIGRKARGITHDAVLPLPMKPVPEKLRPDRETLSSIKASLGFPATCKVMVTIASAYKYEPSGGVDFLATIEEILRLEPEAVLLAIGPSARDAQWRRAMKKSNGRIRALGIIPNSELDRYLSIADVALESFPFNSPTALMELARYRIPCLTLATPAESVDAFEEAGIVCATQEELISRTIAAMHETEPSMRLYNILERDALQEGFSRRLRELYDQFPTQHTFRAPPPDPIRPISPFEKFIAENRFAQPRTFRYLATLMVRHMLNFYVRTMYPHGMRSGLYHWLNSYGLM
jgi:hypothetical protein